MKPIDVILPGFVCVMCAAVVWLTVRWMPMRPQAGRRGLLAATLLVAATTFVSLASGGAIDLSQVVPGQPAAEFLVRTLLFLGMVATIHACCDLELLPTLFCSVACFSTVILAEGVESTLGIVTSALMGVNVMGDPLPSLARMTLSAVLSVGAFRGLFLSHIDGTRLGGIGQGEMGFMVALDLLVCVGFDFVAASTIGAATSVPLAFSVFMKLALCAFCALVLFAEYEMLYRRHLTEENLAMEHLLAEKGRQYELSRQSIEAINARGHDLLHELWATARGEGAETEDYARLIDELNVFDASIETGNQALDVVLTEKSLVCRHSGIRLSCVANGRTVAHLSPADTYALFSSVLEDAISSVQRVANPLGRSIDVLVKEHGDLATIHVGSSRSRVGEDESVSIRAAISVVERYGGTASCASDGESFQFNALIPLP